MSNPKIIEEKKRVIDEIARKFEKASGVYFTDFKGMNVKQVNEMRREFDKEEVEYKIYKNNYISFALKEDSNYDEINKCLIGNTSLAITYTDPIAPARVMKGFNKKYKLPFVKAAVIEGKFFDAVGVKAIANLPSKDELLSQMVAGIQAPISGLVFTLGGIINNFVNTIDAIKQKNEK